MPASDELPGVGPVVAITYKAGVVRGSRTYSHPSSPHDLRAVGSTVSLVEATGRPFVSAVTQAKLNPRLTIQAVAVLSEHGAVAPAIMNDVDYAGSMMDGRTVLETDPKGRSAIEVEGLWTFVKAQIAKSTKAR